MEKEADDCLLEKNLESSFLKYLSKTYSFSISYQLGLHTALCFNVQCYFLPLIFPELEALLCNS